MASAQLSYAERATQYARDVISSKINVCRWVKLAGQRHLNDFERNDIYFDEEAANKVCRFAEGMVHVEGAWAGKHIVLEDWQCFVLSGLFGWKRVSDGLRKYTEADIFVPRKNSKALALDTRIPTPLGWTTIGEIKIGNKVFSDDGTMCEVIAVSEIFINHDCYKITFSNNESVIADAGHLWLTDSRIDRDRKKGICNKNIGPKPSIKTTEEIKNTLFCRHEHNHRIKMPSPIIGTEKILPIHPYLLGAWLGDGNSSSAVISCGDKDVQFMESQIASFGYDVQKRKDRSAWRLQIRATHETLWGDRVVVKKHEKENLQKILCKLNLKNNKHIPKMYLRASFKQRLELLQGLMDTDGTCNKTGISQTYTTISEKLRDGVAELLASMGLKYSIKKKRMRCNGVLLDGFSYNIMFNSFKDLIPVFKMPRKLERMRDIGEKGLRSRSVQIVSADRVDSVPVRCIQVNSDSGIFLFGNTMLPTHNSTIAASIGNYMLCADGEQSAEVYSGATSREQALEVFKPAWRMVQRNKEFKEYFGLQQMGTDENPGSIFRPDDGSSFKALVHKPGDGSSPTCGIVDEYHEHKTPSLYNMFKTGMGAREKPILFVITTAGTNTSVPCFTLQKRAEAILEGSVKHDHIFALIYTIDESDDWQDFKVWIKANPNYGVSIYKHFLKQQYDMAMTDVGERNELLCKHLNIWSNAGSSVFDMAAWGRCADSSISIEDYRGCRAFVGMDLATKTDLAALFFYVAPDDGRKPAFFAKCYIPRDTAKKPENANYRQWEAEGWMTVTEGARTDFGVVEEDLKQIASILKICGLGYDPREATDIVNRIAASKWTSFDLVEINQGPNQMNEPMKEMEALIAAEEIVHQGDPCLTWQIGNTIRREGKGGGPVKSHYPSKEADEFKIDAAVAGIMAVKMSMMELGLKESIYESRGLISFTYE